MSREGARLAREAADAWSARTPDRPRFVAGAVGPLNVSLSVSPKVDDSVLPLGDLRRGSDELCGADRRARRGRRGPAPRRDDLRHAQREGGDRRRGRRRTGAAALAVVHRDRPERAQSLGADGGGLLGVGRARAAADRRGQLLARSERDAPVRRGAWRAWRTRTSPATRTPVCRTRWASTTSSPRTRAATFARSPTTASSTSSVAAAGRRRSTSGRSPRQSRGSAPRTVPSASPARDGAGSSPSRSVPTPGS